LPFAWLDEKLLLLQCHDLFIMIYVSEDCRFALTLTNHPTQETLHRETVHKHTVIYY